MPKKQKEKYEKSTVKQIKSEGAINKIFQAQNIFRESWIIDQIMPNINTKENSNIKLKINNNVKRTLFKLWKHLIHYCKNCLYSE